MRSMSWIELNKMQTYGWHSFSVKTIQKKLRREISEKVQNKYQITKIILKFHHFLYRIIINYTFFAFFSWLELRILFSSMYSRQIQDSVSISFHHVAFGELAWNRNPKIQGEKRRKKIVNKEKEMK